MKWPNWIKDYKWRFIVSSVLVPIIILGITLYFSNKTPLTQNHASTTQVQDSPGAMVFNVQDSPGATVQVTKPEEFIKDDESKKNMLRQIDEIHQKVMSPETNINKSYPGGSLHFIVSISKIDDQRRKYILDAGTPDRNRVSLYLGEDNSIGFRIIDSAGEAFTLKIPKSKFELEKFFYWVFEYGIDEGKSFMRVFLNGKLISYVPYDYVLSLNIDYKKFVIGANLLGQQNGGFTLSAWAISSKTLTTKEQLKLLDYVREKYKMFD